jgi:acetyltransferase-like isoleucine patch superfamily enzyme
MKTNFKFLILLVLMALLVIPAGPAYAQGITSNGGRVIFGSNYTIEKGDTFNGDLVVFGGNVTVEEDAKLNGNLVVLGGTISDNGNVTGDVVVIGGQVNLQEKAVVAGDLVTVGGQSDVADGAVVKGEVVKNVAPDIQFPNGRIPPQVVVPNVQPPHVDVNFNPFLHFFQIFFWSFIIAGFAMLLTLFWQTPIERAGNTIVTQPLMSGVIGLVATLVGIIFALTILPPLVVAFAWLFGVVAIGREVGERLAAALNQHWTPVITIGSGTFLIMVIGGALGTIPCLGGLLLFLAGLVAVGGAVSTWFNLRPTLRPNVTVYTPPTDSTEVPPAS